MTETTTSAVPMQGTPPLADTSDMAQVHRVFRDAITAAPSLISSAAAGAAARLDLVVSYYRNVLALLHAHHDGEDELIWPLLMQRAPHQSADIQRIAAQHENVDPALQAAADTIEAWQHSGDVASGRDAASAIAELGSALLPHLDEEEEVIVPLAAKHIFAPEWGELPGHALRTFSGDKMWLILGLIREQMTPKQLAAMDAHMAPPVLALWQQRQADFTGFVAALRRTSSPQV